MGRLSITEVPLQHHPSITATQSMDVTTPPGSAAPLKPSASTTSTTSVGGVIGRASISDGPLLGTRDGTAFIPDFTVYCMETTTFMKVSRNLYLTAYKASIMERQRRADGSFGAATGSLSGVDGEDDGIMFGTESDVSPRLPPVGLNTTASAKQLSAGKPSPTGSTSASNRGHGGSGGAGVVDGLPPKPDDNIKSNSSNHGLNQKLSDNHSRKSSDSINSIQKTIPILNTKTQFDNN
ncbi:unnamed protein product [Medioppia subpectinata]|uniref:Uncharacterized protein n=1 Tax=Medioppia subpectinata TaxID=1979941 RepID=A0A7R9LW10_9ACAR|nr:unnamed protein product [Medioppia subpectinata]CAG2122234.1 unnamed protein product [Medioppia subpectinata]